MTEGGSRRIALHVSRASPHSREEWEWRFQNPADATPVSAPGHSLPLLVGLDVIDRRPVLIVVDGRSRLSREARFGILFDKRISSEAARNGWSEQVSNSGERIFGLWPRLFPVVVEMINSGVDVDARAVSTAASASGLLDNDSDQAGERATRTVSVLVRDAKFSRSVRSAYEHRCAMCRVGLGLVAGAHILPVSAPGAPDRVWNGIALCHNHHAAFDAHGIFIARDHSIVFSPSLVASANQDEPSVSFLQRTREALWLPQAKEHRPKRAMLRERYKYFEGQYEWAPRF